MARNPSISLTEHQQKNIQELIESGRYQSVSEIMRAGLRLLVDQERQRTAVVKQLEKAALEGLNSAAVDDFDVDKFLAEKRKKWSGV
ncbi:type II toxin-antitoxin system ParD family antitoxin [Pelagibius sp. Alg239-R121]|uniref:type II toxin-antitoxin system ParD family antitoxin n=1 Tax=Pelagibius sp. Alg239-R121 TaxID=2993448 RepID=UPI0024A778CE|nr:type II toxin-antitoxin system ParD family antitoxin [Pelagibius sp. Alg239-R121]